MQRRPRALLFGLALALLAGTIGAAEPVREFDNREQRERYYELLERLRCLVCQNESLASSSADLARDMRDEVYRLVVEEGRSKEAAIDFLTQRYGDFVLYRPPFQPTTWLLWLGPFVLLAIGAAVMTVIVRQRRNAPEPELGPGERERAQRLLDADSDHEDTAE
jgi:cytochrome c-type biogenesis protein CcmH